MNFYPLASNSWDNKEIDMIHKVINTNLFTMGNCVKEYEKRFANFFGSKYCVMTSSGSTANLLMIAACFYTNKAILKKGDEVLVPAVSWSTTYYPLYQYGLKLKFIDIDKKTLNIDLSKIKNAISDKTKALLVVNLLGNPNNFEIIKKITKDNNIVLLEDNCESMGASFKDKQTGTFGIMGTFSSFFSHHISTMEGGYILTDNEELYHILLCLRAHGWTRDLPMNNMVTEKKKDDYFYEAFNFVLPGYNVRPLEISAAIGLEQLKKLPSFLRQRRKNAKYFQSLFRKHPYLLIQEEIGTSSWFGFSLVIKDDLVKRNEIISKLKNKGIECRPIVAGNFTKNKVIKYFNYEIPSSLNNADIIDKNGFFVGNHNYDIKDKISCLREVLS